MNRKKAADVEIKLELTKALLDSIGENYGVLKAYEEEVKRLNALPGVLNTQSTGTLARKNLKLDRLPTITIMQNKIIILRRELLEMSTLLNGIRETV